MICITISIHHSFSNHFKRVVSSTCQLTFQIPWFKRIETDDFLSLPLLFKVGELHIHFRGFAIWWNSVILLRPNSIDFFVLLCCQCPILTL